MSTMDHQTALQNRASGILMHITSLPSPYGIGTFGKEAYRFVDFLHAAGQRYWQILPLGPTGYGDSPYQTFSTFAGNPYLVDLDLLVKDRLLKREELQGIDWGRSEKKTDFAKIYAHRGEVLRKAYARGWQKEAAGIRKFELENHEWLDGFALYTALKKHYEGKPWLQWPEEIRTAWQSPDRENILSRCRSDLLDDVQYQIFVQYEFDKQWTALRAYAVKNGIAFIGDVPIYVPLDSSDVWCAPDQFQLDENLKPKEVAGVPPDAFTADGQLWGNPLYDWDHMKQDGYRWWIRRLKAAAELFDVVRIDHFRGLASYWAVPAKDRTARGGSWKPGPGKEFIRTIREACPEIRFIAEDLGFHTPDVQELLDYSGFPGMKVLEFAFNNREPSDYLPHSYPNNCVCYVGTHDNATCAQWLHELSRSDRAYAKGYMGLNEQEGYVNGVIRAGMGSDADLFVSQMQDWLLLGKEARMNLPGSFGSPNWQWRMTRGVLDARLRKRIRYMTQIYGRLPDQFSR